MNNPTQYPPAVPPRVTPPPAKGFLPARTVRAVSFTITAACIVASVVTCILAIWDFAQRDSLWRLAASFVVVAAGTGLFSSVNEKFGERD